MGDGLAVRLFDPVGGLAVSSAPRGLGGSTATPAASDGGAAGVPIEKQQGPLSASEAFEPPLLL